jgi:hypothetical protein
MSLVLNRTDIVYIEPALPPALSWADRLANIHIENMLGLNLEWYLVNREILSQIVIFTSDGVGITLPSKEWYISERFEFKHINVAKNMMRISLLENLNDFCADFEIKAREIDKNVAKTEKSILHKVVIILIRDDDKTHLEGRDVIDEAIHVEASHADIDVVLGIDCYFLV